MFQIDFYFSNLKTHDMEIFQSQDYLGAISGVVDDELVVGPSGVLDAVAAAP